MVRVVGTGVPLEGAPFLFPATGSVTRAHGMCRALFAFCGFAGLGGSGL